MLFSNREKLLADVLHDAEFEKFRAALREQGEREYRRRHRRRAANWWPLAMAASILVIAAFWHFSRNDRRIEEAKGSSGVGNGDSVVALAVVRSQPLQGVQLVVTRKNDSVEVATSGPGAAEIVTTSTGPLPVISDAELLAMLPDQALGFVEGRGGKQLVVFVAAPEPTIDSR